ncbi:ester cyclase [Algibacter aquimarinus]|uniref:SnoaL-like domain-containing protein n=1 Tax=Algibacter aquimarinus TaxID=1136748 RepID=A0ABP9HR83_9FLAO
MKKIIQISTFSFILLLTGCNSGNKQLQDNIAMYSNTWGEIINKGNLDLINESHFTSDVTLIISPENVVGIEDFKAYYSEFVTGFSNVEFTLVDIFGQGDKIVKHWNFKGTHSGNFFGIPATGKSIDVEGTTLVKMKNGKIAQEQDFMDGLIFMEQLGIDPFLNPSNTAIIQKVYNDFANGDIPAVGAAMAEDIVWNEAENFPLADGNPYIGFDSILNGVFARIGSDWEYWKLEDLELHELTNNKILATGRYNAKYKKNGAIINLQMAHLWKIIDGKIVSFQQYADTKGINDAMNK